MIRKLERLVLKGLLGLEFSPPINLLAVRDYMFIIYVNFKYIHFIKEYFFM